MLVAVYVNWSVRFAASTTIFVLAASGSRADVVAPTVTCRRSTIVPLTELCRELEPASVKRSVTDLSLTSIKEPGKDDCEVKLSTPVGGVHICVLGMEKPYVASSMSTEVVGLRIRKLETV